MRLGSLSGPCDVHTARRICSLHTVGSVGIDAPWSMDMVRHAHAAAQDRVVRGCALQTHANTICTMPSMLQVSSVRSCARTYIETAESSAQRCHAICRLRSCTRRRDGGSFRTRRWQASVRRDRQRDAGEGRPLAPPVSCTAAAARAALPRRLLGNAAATIPPPRACRKASGARVRQPL